ncbi:hypothetical protein [Acinetobacter portensis]|uniref:hypothetical protein n=1 Tax=Acinetobacter portensis TaxID=1839785 RepID=UPI0013D10288|nr:hypothetical protein [Acinetobacter portensis]
MNGFVVWLWGNNLEIKVAEKNTQALVLQQPKDQMIHLDLQHSTDTTAIWSFVIAMVVAFILGISATIIAIWYGRKSFQLTEMSFKTVSEDIKQAAETHRLINDNILRSQENSRSIEIKLTFNQDWSEKLISSLSELTSNLSGWILRVIGLSKQIEKSEQSMPNFRLSEDTYFMSEIKLIKSSSDDIHKLINKLVIYVSLFNSENEYNEILFLLNSLKIEILDLTTKSIQMESLDTEAEKIYEKNLLIFSEINKLLQNEKVKILKAA